MRYEIDPGRKRKTINWLDNIVYSHSTDLDGNLLELTMSIMLQNGNSEMKVAAGVEDEIKRKQKPAIVWVPGQGYRMAMKNLMAAECEYLADNGYVVAVIVYHSSAQAKYPQQEIDIKTAIRFLRTNADKYEIDSDHIGVMGRSAGGQLSALAAMNTDDFESDEWTGVSSKVQAAYDMFGPVDFIPGYEFNIEHIKDPSYRWHREEDTHEGMLFGGDMNTLRERLEKEYVGNYINQGMSPLLIMHGDADPLVNFKISEVFYDKISEAGMEPQTDFYQVKHAGHGTPEFFQPETKAIVLKFFNKYLKGIE